MEFFGSGGSNLECRMKIYIGNVSYNTTEDQIRQAFENFGETTSVNMITDRDSGRPKGFGFVEMTSDEEGQAAIDGLNGTDFDGRTIKVNVARPRTEGGGGRGGNSGRY